MLVVQVLIPAQELKQRLAQWAQTSTQYPYFKGSSQDLASWFATVERACDDVEVPDVQYADAAIALIQGELADVMEERKTKFLETSGHPYWSWEDFKNDLTRVVKEADRIMKEKEETPLDKTKAAFVKLREEHPFLFASAGTCLTIGGSFVVVPALGILALNAIGFTSVGVAGGSLAAMIQSIFYRGATTGLFSLLQSVGATAVLPSAGSIVAGASAMGAGVASLVSGSKTQGNAEGANDAKSRPQSTRSHDHPPPYEAYPSGSAECQQNRVQYEVYRSRRRV